jgi:signal transduction histidine kinase
VIATLRPNRWSLAQRLSLLLFTVLTVIVTTFGVTAYREVQEATRTSAADRLTGVARELARSSGRNIAQRRAEWRSWISDPQLQRALRTGTTPPASIIMRLAQAQRGPDSTLLGRALVRNSGAMVWRTGAPAAVDSLQAIEAARYARQLDSVVVSEFYVVDSTPHVVFAVPIHGDGNAAGALVSWYRVGRNPGSEAVVSNLLGVATQTWLVNRRGTVWLDGRQRPAEAPVQVASLDSAVNRPAGRLVDRWQRTVFAAVAEVPGTPYRVMLLQQEAHTLARPRALGARFGSIALVLILLSTAAVWWISRQMHRDLEAQNTALQEANAAKARFLGVMSHELRTPLNAIAGHAELIALGIHGPTTPDQEQALTRIQRNKDQLLHLVNDLLFFARLDSQPLPVTRERVPLQEQLDALAENLRHEFDRKGLALVVHPSDVVLIGDAVRIQQVLVNLVTNAWRFTDTGGQVEVRADMHGARCRIEVRDTGVGIAPEDLPHVFEPFVQVDGSLTRRSGGAGLGLTIVRTLVHAMGGEVAAESTPKKGSTFRCWLPCVPRPCPVPADPITLSGSGPASVVPENSRTLT